MGKTQKVKVNIMTLLQVLKVITGSEKGKCKITLELEDTEKSKYRASFVCHWNYVEYIKKAFSRISPVTLAAKEEEKIVKLIREEKKK